MSAAKKCRELRWKVGTIIVKKSEDASEGEYVEMRITGIGESAVLTRRKGMMEFAHSNLDGFFESGSCDDPRLKDNR